MRNIISKILFTLLVLTMGIGSVWGTDQTFTVEGPVASKRYVQNNIMMTGEPNTKKIANGGSNVAVFYLQTGNYGPLVIISKAANIKKVEIYGNRDTGSNSQAKAFNLYTSADAVTYAIPTTGFTATATNNGVNTTVSSMSDINMIGNNQSYATTITVNFTSPVMAIRLVASANTSIRSVVVTYDDAITPTTELCELHMTSATEFSFSGTGSFTKTNIQSGNTLTDTEATPNTYYYTKTSGAYGYIDLGEGKSFQAGDEIWFDLMTSSRCAGNNARVTYKLNTSNSDDGAVSINPTCSIAANMATYVRYITQAGDPWVGERTLYIRRADSNNRLYQVTIHRAPVSETCPSGLSITGTASYTEGQTISLSAGLDAGNGSITYTWYKGADLASAKTAGSIGTGTSFSKANCVTGDAGKYWCVATKAECSDAESSAYTVSVSEATKYDVAFAAGTGATGEMTTLKKIEGATVTIPAPTFTAPSGKYFSNWTIAGVEGKTSGQIGETFAMPAGNVTLTANWVSSLEGNVVFNVAVKNTAASQTTTIPFYISGLVGETSDGAGTVSDISKTDRSGKYATNCTEGKGVKFTFNVKDGFEFAPTAIAVQLASVSTYADFTFTATLSDENSNVLTSNEIVPTSDGTLTTITFPAYNKSFKGTTTLLLSVCKTGDAGTYRIGKPITITGTIKAEGACTSPTISWDGDQPSSAFTTDGSKTFKVNSNYTDGIALELSENTCGATIAVKPETDNKQWVVSFTGAGSVKVTPKVVGDGSTVCAEIVSGTAKTLTVTQAYTVTFNMNGHGAAITPQVVASGSTATAPFVADVDGWVLSGWYTDAECTAGNEFSFSTAITANRPLYAKWTADACSLDRQSLSKVVLTSATEGTVTGYNSNEYAGIAVIASLKDDGKTADIIGDATEEHGYKLNSSGKSIVFATLKKGDFQEGDKVIVGVIKKNDQRTVDESTDILTIYAGSDKDHVLEVATIKNVNAPGFYTYRLTAANATAINTAGYKSIGVFRASANGENHNIYSVEITGCRSWTITHNVTFDMKGHGTQVDPQVVAEGDPVTKPSDPVAANWAFCGWYKETTLENEWNFTTDVMGTGDFTLYAKWEDETGAIKLFDGEGNLNTTHFVSAPKNADPIEIASVEYPCLTQFAANRTSLGGAVPADFVQYNATTDAAKIKITLYNTNSGEKSALLYMVEEGDTEFTPVEIKVPGQTIFTTSYYTFNSTKNRSFYLCAKDRSNIRVLQVTVMDNGNAIHMAGQAGYSMNFNKGRMYVPTSAATSFEGATINVSSEYKVANNSSLATNSYISFTTTVDKTVLRVTRAGGNYYVSQDPDNKGTSYSTNQEIELSPAGTWYIGSINPGSAASFSKIEFIAPKCEEPAFNALANSDLCEGDGFAALDGTGTVSDGGTITYKWYAHGADESDPTAVLATTATYTPTADGIYYVKALHHVDGLTDNEVTSSEVTVTHFASAVITAAPANVRKSAGEAAALTVEATGKNLSYAWYTCDDALGTNPVAIVPAETNATLNVMVPDGIQYYMVIVSSDCGADLSAVAKVEKFVALPQLHINATTTWDLTTCADAEIVLTSSTSPKKGEECLMANIEGVHLDANFNSQALVISGEYIYRNISGKPTCAEYMKFITDVEGVVTVTFAGNGSNRLIRVTGANGVQYSTVSAGTGDTHTEKFYVTPGEVELMGMNAAMTQDKRYMRFFNITFTAEPDYIRPTTEGRYGTICLPNGGVMVGADLFEVAYYGATSQKIFFDQIMNGEMEAGIPYIFLPKEGVSQLGVYYTDAAGSTAGNRNGLYGSYTTEVLTRNDGNYVLYNNQYLYVGDESTNVKVGANRAYIKLAEITPIEPALAPGRRRVSMGVIGAPQVTTGVGELNADETPIKVMIDGQLYIICGEKMYDATGRLVK